MPLTLGSRSTQSISFALITDLIERLLYDQIRPTEEELKEMGPEFNELWVKYFKNKPDKPVMYVLHYPCQLAIVMLTLRWR